MKKIHLIIILIFITVISCNEKKSNQIKQKSEINKNAKGDSIKSEKTKDSIQIQKIEIKIDSLILVDILTKFYYNKDYYISLSFKNQYSDSIARIIDNSFGETIFENDMESRIKIPSYIAEKYFSANGLDKLIIINKDQEIIDTISRKNYEFYDASIESSYVATYEIPYDLGDSLIVISTNVNDYLKLNKTSQPTSNFEYDKRILQNNISDYDEIFSQTTIINKSDTISVLSFGNYSEYKNYLYLFKNGNLKDSIINDYMAISSLTAIPLATENELTYIYSGFKPDTDWLWNGLMGIDLINWKFKLYDRNRIER